MQTILLVCCESGFSRPLSTALAGEYQVLTCAFGGDVIETMLRKRPAAVMADWDAVASQGTEPPRWLACCRSCAPVIALVDLARPKQVIHAARLGVSDILSRESTIGELRDALRRIVRTSPPEELAAAPFIGSSPALLEAASKIRLYADSEYPVLILGESGTGKELAARAIHRYSRRHGGAFVGRNCAALPDLLAESELFGTERGAFTDAVHRPGAFELARGGVLFLDEVCDASRPVQAKLLRALETGEFWPLGARGPSQSDIRLVSASGRDLQAAVAAGDYRADLLYRMDTLTVSLPPLRECREDIPDIAAHFVIAASQGRMHLNAAAIRKLKAQDWPGNVRQLRNVIHRAIVHARGGHEIGAGHLQL